MLVMRTLIIVKTFKYFLKYFALEFYIFPQLNKLLNTDELIRQRRTTISVINRKRFIHILLAVFLSVFSSIISIPSSSATPECPSTYPSLCIGQALSGGGGGGLCNGRPCQGALRTIQG